MPPAATLICVSTSSDILTTLESITKSLLAERLVACVQISGPVSSHYWWAGALTQSSEYLLTAKSRADLLPAIEAVIRRLHHYELPEIISVQAEASQEYHQWVLGETTADSDEKNN